MECSDVSYGSQQCHRVGFLYRKSSFIDRWRDRQYSSIAQFDHFVLGYFFGRLTYARHRTAYCVRKVYLLAIIALDKNCTRITFRHSRLCFLFYSPLHCCSTKNLSASLLSPSTVFYIQIVIIVNMNMKKSRRFLHPSTPSHVHSIAITRHTKRSGCSLLYLREDRPSGTFARRRCRLPQYCCIVPAHGLFPLSLRAFRTHILTFHFPD